MVGGGDKGGENILCCKSDDLMIDTSSIISSVGADSLTSSFEIQRRNRPQRRVFAPTLRSNETRRVWVLTFGP